MSLCPKCQYVIQPGWKVCPSCGTDLDIAQVCQSCQKELQPDWKACPFCGARISGPSIEQTRPRPADTDRSSASGYLTCPLCGDRSTPDKTFTCLRCNREGLCQKHRNNYLNVCKSCEGEALRDLGSGELGTLYGKAQTNRDWDYQVEVMKRTVELDPRNHNNLFFLASSYYKTGADGIPAALMNLYEAISLVEENWNKASYLLTAAEWQLEIGNKKQAKDHLKEALQLDRSCTDFLKKYRPDVYRNLMRL